MRASFLLMAQLSTLSHQEQYYAIQKKGKRKLLLVSCAQFWNEADTRNRNYRLWQTTEISTRTGKRIRFVTVWIVRPKVNSRNKKGSRNSDTLSQAYALTWFNSTFGPVDRQNENSASVIYNWEIRPNICMSCLCVKGKSLSRDYLQIHELS
jgi:hypothetical protein